MERQKILNPLTGRMVYADGVTAKNIPKMKKKVAVLEGAIQRKTTTKISEKKEAVGKLSGAIKRTLAKKPEPKKLYSWDDLPDDIKAKISAIVKENKSGFNQDGFDGRDYAGGGQGFLRINDYIGYVNQVLADTDVSYEKRMELRKDAIENIEEANGDRIMVETYTFNRKMRSFIKDIYKKSKESVPVISDLGTGAVFIVPDYSNDFYYDMAGGYGGDGYAVLVDGRYMDSDEYNARGNKIEGYEDDPDADKIVLFGNPNLIAILEEDEYENWEWEEPEYDEYVLSDEERNKMVDEWFEDNDKKNGRKVELIPDWDDENERFERSSGSGSGSGSRSSNSRSSNSRSYS